MKSKRIIYLDVLRCLACLAVIMIHTSAGFVVKNFGCKSFWMGNILDSLSRFAVPIFIMISGALLLDSKYDYSNKKNIKHIKKLIGFYFFWSLLYSIYSNLYLPYSLYGSMNYKKFILSIISGPYHLWFIPMLCGLYLILPILRLWINKKNKKEIQHFMILSTIFIFFIPQFIRIVGYYYPDIQSFKLFFNSFNLQFVGGYTLYFILGWYLNNYDVKRSYVYSLGVIGILFSVIATYLLSIDSNMARYEYDNLSMNILFYSIMVFVLVKSYCSKKEINKRILSIVNSISKYSLGIYAIHALIIDRLNLYFLDNNIYTAIIVIPVTYIITFVVSYLISIIMSKIKPLKRFVI